MLRLAWVVVFIFILAMAAHADVEPEEIVGIWLLDEDDGDVAEDSSGNEHHGQIQVATWTDGKFGSALLFERSGAVEIISTEKLQLGDEFTMMAYFNAEELDDWHQIIAKDSEYLLRIDPPSEGGSMSAFVNLAGGWEPRASANVPTTDTWIHFAAVYNSDDSTLKIYVNGVSSGQSTHAGKPNPGTAPVTLGHWNNGNYFNGIIDDVAIFNIAMEEEDILSIATIGLKEFLGAGQSVKPSGKLASAWGNLKK